MNEYSTCFRREYYYLKTAITAGKLEGQTTKTLNHCPRTIIRLPLLTSVNIPL